MKQLLIFLLILLPAGTALAAEPPAAPMLRLETGFHTAMIRRIAADAQGRWLATASEDKLASSMPWLWTRQGHGWQRVGGIGMIFCSGYKLLVQLDNQTKKGADPFESAPFFLNRGYSYGSTRLLHV